MRHFFANGLHHLRETGTLFLTNKVSNVMSLLSTVLVFLFLGVILMGWRTTSLWVALIQEEAEIQVFVLQDEDAVQLQSVADAVRQLDGVASVSILSAEDARIRMATLLGSESGMLSHLEENPFRPFLEVRFSLQTLDTVLGAIRALPAVELVRDNRDVLQSLLRLQSALQTAGLAIGGAVALFTVVLLSHIARVGVVHNRDQIRTLRLLGAPEPHIAMPFFLLGIVLGGGGGLVASLLLHAGLSALPGNGPSVLPFLPMPDTKALGSGLVPLLCGAGALLASLGTLFGIVSARGNHRSHELP